MYKFRVIMFPVAMFMWIITTLAFIEYSRDVYTEFQRLRLDVAVNYAVDAAVDEMVAATSDLHLDYGEHAYLTCDPEVALDTFVTIFLENYGMIDSAQNRLWVTSNYMPAFLVAGYDGYYIAQPTKINSSGAYDAVFSIKQPYLYRDGSSLYSLNLGLQDCKKFESSIVSQVSIPITEFAARGVINDCVSDAFMKTVYNQLDGSMQSAIYIPSDMGTFTRTNPIENTTVIAYITNMPSGYGTNIEAFGIGGARVQHERFVGAYIKDGKKFYQYIDLIDRTTCNLVEVYETPQQAAEAGYEFDLSPLY